MGISLSGGPWQYNRFDRFDEAAKPDYLDFDKDGNKEEPMKKALKEKGKKKCPKCGKSPCECGKSDMKEWVNEMVEEGIDLSEYTWDDMIEIFNEQLGNTVKPSSSISMNRKAENKSGSRGPELTHSVKPSGGSAGGVKSMSNGSMPKGGTKPSAMLKKEEVCSYLMSEGFANNPVSAEIMFNHMSEDWLDAIEETYKGKHGQSEKEYQDGRSYGGKLASGDSKTGPKGYVSKMFKDKPVKPGEKPSPLKMSKGDRNELDIRKNDFMKKHGYKSKK